LKNLNVKEFNCTGCALCESVCPVNAITIRMNKEGFLEYIIDESKCLECEECTKVCPKLNIKKDSLNKEKKTETLAAYTKNRNKLRESSSGGIFTELAENIIDNDGVVVGAGFVEHNELKHIPINKKEDLFRLRGSKYIQSNTSNIYRKVEQLLDIGKKVLYTGVSCQIVAMKKYIAIKDEERLKDRKSRLMDNLFLVDIVCHGIPSNDVYKKSLIDRFEEAVEYVNFRDKKNGWGNYYLSYFDKDYKLLKSIIHTKDEFFQGYVQNRYLNKACYECEANGIPRVGDISLGDFWGIKTLDVEFAKLNQNEGVSIVIINTEKGKTLFDNIKDNIIFKEENLEDAIKHNPRIKEGTYNNVEKEKRRTFYEKEKETSFKKKRYVERETVKKVIIRKIAETRHKIKIKNKK